MTDIPGKYVREKTSSHYIELKPDGNYFLFNGSAGITGAYEISGSEITISVGDSTSRGTIADGVIIDDEGEKWIRQVEPIPAGRNIRPVTPSSTSKAQPTRQQAISVDDDPLPSMSWLPAPLRRLDFPWELIEAAGLLIVLLLVLAVGIAKKP